MLIQKRTPTEKQIAASRANGAKSKGPNGPRRNGPAIRHVAEMLLLPGESPARFREFSKSLLNELQPGSHIETLMVQSLIVAGWRQMRAVEAEHSILSRHLGNIYDPDVPFTHRNADAAMSALANPGSELAARREMRFARESRDILRQLKTYREWRLSRQTAESDTEFEADTCDIEENKEDSPENKPGETPEIPANPDLNPAGPAPDPNSQEPGPTD